MAIGPGGKGRRLIQGIKCQYCGIYSLRGQHRESEEVAKGDMGLKAQGGIQEAARVSVWKADPI